MGSKKYCFFLTFAPEYNKDLQQISFKQTQIQYGRFYFLSLRNYRKATKQIGGRLDL